MDKWNLIAKCLSENASDSEQEELNIWLAESIENRKEFDRAKLVWEVAFGETEETLFAEDLQESASLWNEIEAQLSSKDEALGVQMNPAWWQTTWARVAAAVLLVVSGVWWLSPASLDEPQIAELHEAIDNWSVLYKAVDSVEVFVLPDHSIVWMRAGSELNYTQDLARNRRHVNLDGEAFFDVKRDTLTPFVISTGDVTTTVLGTQFQVKTYPSGNVEVHVESGSVRVDAVSAVNKATAILKPGDKIYYSSALHKLDTMESLLADVDYVNEGHWRHTKAPSASAERLRPERFIKVETNWKLNAIRMTVVEGKVTNKAKATTYTGIVLRVKHVSDKSGKMTYKDIIVEGEVAPGKTLEFKKTLLIDWFRDPSDVAINVEEVKFME